VLQIAMEEVADDVGCWILGMENCYKLPKVLMMIFLRKFSQLVVELLFWWISTL
jgi:hypothetical protein